MFEVYHSF